MTDASLRKESPMKAGRADWDVCFLILPDSLILDWAGPAEALRMANKALLAQGLPAPFRLRFIGPQATAASSVGALIGNLEPLPESFERPSWLVVLGQTGECVDIRQPAIREAIGWLSRLKPQNGRLELLTVCAGAVLAAHAGLLRGRCATTHHEHLAELATAEPLCEVNKNRIFVLDPPVYSSAGVTTGIDLILHRVAQLYGPAVAAQVAQSMVLALRRSDSDPQVSPFLIGRNHLHPALHRLQDAIAFKPQQTWSVAEMAAFAHTSVRHLGRLFLDYAGMTPLNYLRQIRLALADAALRSGHGVSRAAELGGFSSDTQLRRAWHRFGRGGTPSASARFPAAETPQPGR